MKTLLKMLGGLLAGGLIGLTIGGLIVVLFTDTTFTEYIHKFYSIDSAEALWVVLVAIGSLVLSLVVLISVHELGHLVCGLLSDYRFVSYRIFNLTLLKINGRFRVKRFAVAGTGGQCLLTPPERPLEEIPTFWYNFGGVFFNILVLVLTLPLLLLDLNPFVAEALGIFALTDAALILLNGLPIKIGGLGNDGFNIKLLNRNLSSKRALVNQLRANALIQSGVRPKDMADSLFSNPKVIDYANALEVAMPMMYFSQMIDRMEFPEALAGMEELYAHKDEIMPLYVKEIACELAYLYLMTGKTAEAEALLTQELSAYIEAYRKTMSSKQRLYIAITLLLDKNEPKARQLYDHLRATQSTYLLQGEVKSDLALLAPLFPTQE